MQYKKLSKQTKMVNLLATGKLKFPGFQAVVYLKWSQNIVL